MFKKLIKYSFITSAIVLSTMALLYLSSCKVNSSFIANKKLILYNNNSGEKIADFPITDGDIFSISFIHSVNKSPVIDYYKFDKNNNIYVFKTTYYGFGAGVQTELNENEDISYGDDGSMTISNINKKIDELTYYLSSVGDHKLRINDDREISLWDTCGKNITISIKIK